MAEEPIVEKKKRARKPPAPKLVFQLPDKTEVHFEDKFHKDILSCHHQVVHEKAVVTIPDAYRPLGDKVLIPKKENPICRKCGLDETNCGNPYLDYVGAENPVATILVESISRKEDDKAHVGAGGINAHIIKNVLELTQKHGVELKDIRWVPITRCCAYTGKLPNYKTKGNWCRHYAIQDLMLHPPKVVIPIGTAVLGLLSHKSNAQDWTGRLLTWRGWPDDWLTNPKFVFDRPDPIDETKFTRGHPLFGPSPNVRIPMVPLQNPNIVLRTQNEVLRQDWREQLVYALSIGKKNVPPPDYHRPWYHITTDAEEIKSTLERVIGYADTYADFTLAYDTETTGLKQWAYFRRLKGSATNVVAPDATGIASSFRESKKIVRSDDEKRAPGIVFMMFRWTNPETGQPESIGFPWDYPESPLVDSLEELAIHVIAVLSKAQVIGHNLVFDELFTISTIGRAKNEYEPFNADGSWNESYLWLHQRINMLAEAAIYDTWHMAFTALQKRGSLGLEILAYDYVQDLAGYEEEMTLLIELNGDKMDPANEQGGHYAMCAPDKWKSHLEPYVMGDVEVTYRAREALSARLQKTKVYKIPLAHPTHHGVFRYYQTPNREWVYTNIMIPANQTLIKMMARGMFIDEEALTKQENVCPGEVQTAKEELRAVDPVIETWCQQKISEAAKVTEQAAGTKKVKTWELDLENKALLKELLFDVLKCPIQRLTKKGQQLYGTEPMEWDELIFRNVCPEEERPYAGCVTDPAIAEKIYRAKLEFAAVDKYTLNRLSVDHPNLRPLQKYRKVYKLYTTYVRPMRNIMDETLDKKERVKDPHLSIDHCIHASFMLTGTRGGRLCVAGDTKLEIMIGGEKILVEIRDLWKYKDQHVFIRTHRGRWRRITRLYFKGYERMYEAVTKSGCWIKATTSHRVFSSRGWQSLGDVIRQKLDLQVDLEFKSGNGSGRAQFSAAGAGEAHELSADERSDFSPCRPSELEGLSGIEVGTSSAASGAISGRAAREPKRKTGTFCASSKTKAGSLRFTRDSGGTDCRGNGHNAVFSRAEYPEVWVAEIGQRSGSRQNFDRESVEKNRGSLSGVDGGVCNLFYRQGKIFQEGLSGVYDTSGTRMVFEGYVPNAFYATEGGQGRSGGNLMVDEPPRVGAVTRVDFSEDSKLSRICLQGQSACGFRPDRHQSVGGNRWGIPHRSSSQRVYQSSTAVGLPGASVYDTASSVQNGGGCCGDTGRFETIVQCRSAGVQAVWDIEVEEDHSYLAQGFFHHNSCRDPNLQQLPNEGEIKRLFVSRFGILGCIYAADLSQIELRLMAAACGDESMVNAYLNDIDIHSLTASKITWKGGIKIPYDHFTKPHMEGLQHAGKHKEAKELELKRKIAKTVNFLTGYGGGAFGLQNVLANNEVYMSLEECEEIIKSFFAAYPMLKRFLGIYKTFIEEHARAVSMFGRVRQFDEIYSEDREASSKALRAGCNHLIQSTASDMMLICLFTIEKLMRDANLKSLLVSTVHDSLVIDALREELPQVHKIVDWVMNNIPTVVETVMPDYDCSWMTVPFAGDSEVGLNYLETNKISGDNPDWEELLKPKAKEKAKAA